MHMETETRPEIPEPIRDIMRDEEVENMRNLDGWAVGTVTLVERGATIRSIDNAWIELFNGAGRAGSFGGVRFMAIDESKPAEAEVAYIDPQYEEAYAYATADDFDVDSSTGWYVEQYDVPDDPDYGAPAPSGGA